MPKFVRSLFAVGVAAACSALSLLGKPLWIPQFVAVGILFGLAVCACMRSLRRLDPSGLVLCFESQEGWSLKTAGVDQVKALPVEIASFSRFRRFLLVELQIAAGESSSRRRRRVVRQLLIREAHLGGASWRHLRAFLAITAGDRRR